VILDNDSSALRRAWHCVAHSDEVCGTPHQVWLLGEAWALVRFDDGSVRAFVDRCPHRSAPISAGTVVNNELQCGYHGWRFDPAGRVAAIPALGPTPTLPPRACLKTAFAIEERFGLVFLAPEEPAAALPEFAQWSDPSFVTAVCETRRTPVSAAQLIDNFMDAAHFPFVHPTTFGVAGAEELAVPPIEHTATSVSCAFEAPYQNHDDPLVATGEHPLVQPHRVRKVGHANFICELELTFPLTNGTFWILYACQPERNGSTRIYKLIARNDLDHDRTEIEQVAKYEDVVLLEDLALLERYVHMHIDLDVTAELHTKADRLSVGWRRLMSEFVTAGETRNTSASQP
jgi:phenylpropionate dioxygenase-like ring-hydroxylating dioxygenase large terminal subunit